MTVAMFRAAKFDLTPLTKTLTHTPKVTINMFIVIILQ
jgi:hypothetical protein